MKKLLLILLFVPLFSYQTFSQSKKALKKVKKIKIINRGLNLDGTFVPVVNKDYFNRLLVKRIEASVESAMFAMGFQTGDYYEKQTAKDANNREMTLQTTRVIKGDYSVNIFTKGMSGNRIYKIVIEDVNNDSRTVATIGEFEVVHKDTDVLEAVFFKLIESNKK